MISEKNAYPCPGTHPWHSLSCCATGLKRVMRKAKFFLMFLLIVLLLNAVPGVTLAQKPGPPQKHTADGVQPLGSWGWMNASRWETPWEGGRPHKLAVWTAPWCRRQQYLGPGGYQDTCSSPHGCIDQWSWWLLSPESKLGVPFSWWLVPWKPERRNIGNYLAECYFE